MSKAGENVAVDVALACTAFITCFFFLYYPMAVCPLLPGIDGPYYAVQVSWLLEKGSLKYMDPPLAFYIMTLIVLLTGNLFEGVKLAASLVTSLAVFPTYAMTKRLTGSRAASLAGSIAMVANPFVVRMVSDFMKNSMGLLWLSTFLYFETAYIEEGDRRNLIGLLASFALTLLTHILDYGVALLYASLLFLFSRGERRKRALIGFLISVVSLALLIAAPFIVGGDVWKGLAFVEEFIESEEEIEIFMPNFIVQAIGIASTLFVAAWLMRDNPTLSTLAASSGFIVLGLNLPLIPKKWLFRFRLMTGVPLSHAAGSAAGIIKDSRGFIVAILIVTMIMTMGVQTYRAVRPSIPPEAYTELEHVLELLKEKELTIVIPDTRIRYWAETLREDIYRDPQPHCAIILMKGRGRTPRGAIVYDGKFFVAFIHEAPPRRGPP